MSERTTDGKAVEEVRAWKAAAWAEVAHLPLETALRERLRIANATAARLGYADRRHSKE